MIVLEFLFFWVVPKSMVPSPENLRASIRSHLTTRWSLSTEFDIKEQSSIPESKAAARTSPFGANAIVWG